MFVVSWYRMENVRDAARRALVAFEQIHGSEPQGTHTSRPVLSLPPVTSRSVQRSLFSPRPMYEIQDTLGHECKLYRKYIQSDNINSKI
jgi:hypothetical protein